MEDEESQRMKLEDTIAKLFRMNIKCQDALDRNSQLWSMKDKAGKL